MSGHVQKRNGRWRARYRAPDGRERSRTFDRRVDAERWLATQTADIARDDWTDPKRGRIRFAEWVDRWATGLVDVRPRTRQLNVGVARNYLVPRFGDWPLSTITSTDIKAMLADELAEGRLSTSAIRRHVMVMSLILQAGVEDGRIGRNHARAVKLPQERSREMRFLEPTEVALLVEAIEPHYRPMVLTAAYVGLRWGELAGLRVANVDTLRNTIRVEEQLVDVNGTLEWAPPKTKAGSRTVTVPVTLSERLGFHFGTAPVKASGLAFPGPRGVPLRATSFRRVWRRATSAAGFDRGPLTGLTFHELRRWRLRWRLPRARTPRRSRSASDTRRSRPRSTATGTCSRGSTSRSPKASTTCSARASRPIRGLSRPGLRVLAVQEGKGVSFPS